MRLRDTAGTGATSLAQWWTRYDDPLLTQQVERALQANPSVARAALHQARALREGAAAALGPRLGSAASQQRSARGTTGGDTVLTTLLGAVAALSLLVGGIGTMSIMLVGVTERSARSACARPWARWRASCCCSS